MERLINDNTDLIEQIAANHKEITKLEYRLTHSERLMDENEAAISSSALHQMVLTNIARLSHHIYSIAKTIEENPCHEA